MNYRRLQYISIISFVVILMTFTSCSQTSAPESDNWELVWQDEFNGPAGSLPDSSNWGYDIGTGWGNNQYEYDTDLPSNVSLDGEGNLVITAIKESYQGQPYTSARIKTEGKFEVTYGKIEARMKLPWGQGIWPAFWLLGSNINSVGWPECGEIDIMELFGNQPFRVMGSVHGPGYSGPNAITKHYDLFNDRFDTGFHTFSVEWSADSIRFFVDDMHYETVTPSNILTPQGVPGTWVFDHPFYIILNLAVGGNPPGPPDASTVFPQKMLVDWVRVYKKNK